MRSRKSTVTIQDVARAAGVSVSTVSRVLNNKFNVNEDFNKTNPKKRGKTSSLGEILKTYQLPPPKRITKSEMQLKRDSLAEQLAQGLHDQKSLGCYRVIAEKIPQHVVF